MSHAARTSKTVDNRAGVRTEDAPPRCAPSNGYASPSELGFRVRWIRQRLKLSLRDVEAKTGISASTLSRLENGEGMETSLGAFLKLSDALETPASELLRAGEA